MKTKILIVGIGGVGGYFGGLLAKEYQQSNNIEIYFLSRRKNLDKIKSDGIKVLDNENEFNSFPKIISDNAKDFDFVDYVFICTKTYHLNEIIQQIRPCISESTVLIPLQNGVNSRDILLKNFESNLITYGCVYLVSRLESPGKIVKKGQVGSLFFGIDNFNDKRLNHLQEVLLKAGIKSELSKSISKVIWEKFTFLSSIATATTYFNAKVHEILKDDLKLNSLNQLIQEVTALAHSKNIEIGENQSNRIIDILKSLPIDATTSLHSDYQNKREKTELESLTGYVISEGKLKNVKTELFEKMYNKIKTVPNTVY
ncbi:2-dehydropantoate 2-reductase [Polaribacter sp. MSW13]|uniref:2-dehydropantoate 2-reductase n=1 Tax=Polaribacter marinus TaxID=2916838 RepID=A0A9X2AKI9_9FLAO|nr:2-dehydropantoate 2-reductase [Polaribacter marinus]MCI2230486.1 2-dehydropantoate 2-reductase [Polaribacter marinus]